MSRHSRASGQDSRTTSVFEVVGSYFCDTFFNHIYHSARTKVAAGGSLTDEYIRLAKTYLIATKTDKKCYTDVVRGVHSYFTATTRYTTLGFAEFVDRIVGVCVPPEYFEKFSTTDKDEILGSIICDLVSNLAAHVTTPDMLRRIIDEHSSAPDMTIRMLQDHAVTILGEKRLTLHNKFLSKAGQAREFVSLAQVEDMKKAMRRLVKEKAEALAQVEELEQSLKGQRREAKAREAKMMKLIQLLRAERVSGPAAAVARLKVPREDRIAERDPFADLDETVPDQEKIAEVRSSSGESESGSGSESESDSADESPPARRKGPVRAQAEKGKAVAGRGATRAEARPGSRAAPAKAPAAPVKSTKPAAKPRSRERPHQTAPGLTDFFRSVPASSEPAARPSVGRSATGPAGRSATGPAGRSAITGPEGPLEKVEGPETPNLLASLLDGSGLLDGLDE